MREENVTKIIIKYLQKNDWKIISFDFPQSGTGIMIHPDDSKSSKNKDAIIPDIIAYKNDKCVFFENKDRFVKSDFEKVNHLIINNKYKKNISKLLLKWKISNFYYGIGLPDDVRKDIILENSNYVDFVLQVHDNETIELVVDKYNVFQ